MSNQAPIYKLSSSKNQIERISDGLRQLKLGGMQTSFEDVCQMALSEHKSPFDMLQTLVELQMEWDNNGHIKRRIDKAGFPYERELTDFNYSLQPSINQQSRLTNLPREDLLIKHKILSFLDPTE